jgi:hypothetical protein
LRFLLERTVSAAAGSIIAARPATSGAAFFDVPSRTAATNYSNQIGTNKKAAGAAAFSSCE